MQEKKQTRGHIIRVALEKEYKDQPMFCGKCGILSVVGKGLDIVYTEHSPTPMFGNSFTIWAACEDPEGCEDRQKRNKK